MLAIKEKNRYGSIGTSPWIVLGSSAILLIVVVILAIQNCNREKLYMTKVLNEKGAALIRAVEAGARTGMRGMSWGGEQVQSLLEETARFPDVDYLMVVQKDGRIVAHSDPSKKDRQIADASLFAKLKSDDEIRWTVVDSEQYGRSFEVYKYFRPSCGMERFHGDGRGRMMGRGRHPGSHALENDWCLAAAQGENGNVILVGLDMKIFEDARAEDVRNAMLISGVLVLLGFAGFVSLFWMQNYRAARRSLSDTSAFAGELVANLPVGLVATDKHGKIVFFNGEAERITGVVFSQAKGKGPNEILPDRLSEIARILDRGERVSEREMECEFVQGKSVPVSVTASRIVNDQGRLVGGVLIVKDLAEIRSLREEVRRKEKLAALGGLAAGVAHEIRNPLSSIKGMASYLGSKFDEKSADREAADVMIREVDRLNRVVGELLEFARPPGLHSKETDINELLRHSVKLVRKEADSKNMEIRLELSQGPSTGFIDPDRFSQCLLNLFINALQAMESNGTLTVRSIPNENGSIAVEIEDTGPGIKGENMAKIFDPYFTTKAKGTGLGLAIAHKIVEAHGGRIAVRNAPKGGALFSIHIPKKQNPRG